MKAATPNIGCRIESDGHLATVRFVGEIPSTKGDWLGVEWDDPTRGKHDGTHEKSRYFTTNHPTSGSFIRPKKANIGTDLVSAVKERYGQVEDNNAGVNVEDMFVVGAGNQQTIVEVVGAHSVNLQQCQFDRLTEVVMRGSAVRDGGPDSSLRSLLPSVKQLDLSKNLLTTWTEAARITQQLPKLTSLNMSENKLLFPEALSSLRSFFLQLRVLYLNRMNYTWEDISKCTEMISNLEQIHMCFNQISTIPDIGPHLGNIRLINLESNPLSSWNQALRFGTLTQLEILILNDTCIETLAFPDVPRGQKSNLFPKLQSLSISDNKISNLRDVNELDKLRSFEELYFKRNPLHSDYADSSVPRTIATAKIQKLVTYNRSKIEHAERRGSELDYLKKFGRDWRTSGGHQDPALNNPSEEFISDHPVYQRLVDKYGPVEDSELVQHTTALRSSLITVHIISQAGDPNQVPLKKKLPVTMTVQKLKFLIKRLYRVNPNHIKLTYSSSKMQGPKIEMDIDQKEIGFYAIEEGDTVHAKWT